MEYTLYDASIVVAKDILASLASIIAKIEASPAASTIVEARIHPDMLPFKFQVHMTTDISHKLVARLTGTEPRELKCPETLEEMKARIAEVQADVDGVDKNTVNTRINEIVSVGMGRNNPPAKMASWQYANGYFQPNAFFHLVTAYDIARKEGVDLGKRDFLTPFIDKHVNGQA